MRTDHEFSKLYNIALFKCLNGFQNPVIFGYNMLGTLSHDVIFYHILVLLKLFKGNVTQTLCLRNDCFECVKCLGTLLAAFVILGCCKASLFIRVGNYDFVTVKRNRNKLVIKILAVEENRMVFLTHCGRKLIHNSAHNANIIMLAALTDFCHVNHIGFTFYALCLVGKR